MANEKYVVCSTEFDYNDEYYYASEGTTPWQYYDTEEEAEAARLQEDIREARNGDIPLGEIGEETAGHIADFLKDQGLIPEDDDIDASDYWDWKIPEDWTDGLVEDLLNYINRNMYSISFHKVYKIPHG